MTTATASDLLDRMQADHDFAVEIHRRYVDPAALRAYLTAEGYTCSDDEIREALLERYGDQLSHEQLEAVSGGHPVLAVVLGIALVAALGVAFGKMFSEL